MREHHSDLSSKISEDTTNFSRLFPKLKAFRPREELLRELGKKDGIMEDTDFGKHGDAKVRSAGITFLGQFITHDITFDKRTNLTELTDPEEVKNYRTPGLDLDCVYGLGKEQNPELYNERDTDLLKVGINDKGKDNDIPRQKNGMPIIGDERNDSTIIVAQLHLAFIKFHNEVVKYVRREKDVEKSQVFETAQKIVRWHYQWMVLHCFLPQIVDNKVVTDILLNGRKYSQRKRGRCD